ncbi:MAG: ABC transporter ATP-binding protein [Eubacteriales bacterium]
MSSLSSAVNKKHQYDYQIESSKDRREASYYPSILFNGEYAKERKMFGYSEWLIDKYKRANSVIIKKLQALCTKIARNLLATNAISNLLSVIIIVIVGREAINGSISIASFSLYISLFASFSEGIRDFLSTYVDLQEKSLYLNYLTDFLSKIESKHIFTGKEPVVRNRIDVIEFKNVYFKYPSEENYTLKDINISFRSDEKICLVGVNGAGKTTLLKLLIGLYAPTEGEILYNGNNIQNLNILEYRNLFSTCFQDFCKYSFTVSENLIFYYQSEQSNQEVVEALKKVGLFDKINGFPNTIHTPLTRYYEESGKELSGGEWQKLSLARAFLSSRAFLILDEPSSNLDAIAENDFFNNIEKNITETGVMFVSHRLSSAKISDKIIVIDNGEIKETGSHSDLMRKDGHYSRLFKMQSERYE